MFNLLFFHAEIIELSIYQNKLIQFIWLSCVYLSCKRETLKELCVAT